MAAQAPLTVAGQRPASKDSLVTIGAGPFLPPVARMLDARKLDGASAPAALLLLPPLLLPPLPLTQRPRALTTMPVCRPVHRPRLDSNT